METPDGLKQLPGSDRRIIWVPARKSLKHAHFKLPDQLSGRKKDAALDLKVQTWSPFGKTDYSVIWKDREASVFAWDKQATAEKIAAHGVDPNRCEVLPEVFLREPLSEGIRLCDTGDGIEGQVWANGVPQIVRWWKKLPSPDEWALFLRNAGLPISEPSLAPPAVTDPDWLDMPWNSSFGQDRLFSQILSNRKLVAMVATLIVTPCAFFFGEWLAFSAMTNRTLAQVAQVEVDSLSIREERNRALTALEYAEDLSSLQAFPHQIEIVSRAHSLMSGYDIEVSGWDYDEGLLEFGLTSDSDLDATVYIPIFENDPMFSRVSASTRGARLVLRMSVSSVADLAP